MVRELNLARRQEQIPQDANPQLGAAPLGQAQNPSSCEHRTVSKDGRIICSKIVEGDNEVSPNVCRSCPLKAANCAHLRFSLKQTLPSPLVVRYNGRTEIWDDGPAELALERAACTAKVTPIHDTRACAGCALRKPIQPAIEKPKRRRQAAVSGKVVSFPSREALAAAG
jgi:hypothetical protein